MTRQPINFNAFSFNLPWVPPLIIEASSLMLGISIGHSMPSWIGMLTALLSLYFTIKLSTFSQPLICACCFTFGVISLQIQKDYYSNLYTITQNKNFSIVGTVEEISENIDNKFPYLTVITTKKIKPYSVKKWLNSEHKIQIYSINKPYVQPGDKIFVRKIKISKPKNSFLNHLIKEGASGTFFTNTFYAKKLKKDESYLQKLEKFKKQLLLKLKNKINPESYSLVSSVFFGQKSENKQQTIEQKNNFKTWGLSHQLARSGLHLAIFILLWQILLSFIPIHIKIKQITVLLMGSIYGLLTWWSISFFRAFLCFFLYKTNELFELQSNFTYLLTLTCLISLVFNPIQLFFLDFQLSFALTFALSTTGLFKTNQI
ncbi:MAG: internalization-like protein competence protein [candidate division TM6 bacterium GW2011_GWF2_32_72]|nr:MAG: internalization-like protein competence protein [candidate division TM6 bacterium GW2011_GWF2_32_72]